MKISILTLASQRDKYIDDLLAEELRKLGHEVGVRSHINAGRETVCYEKPDVVIPEDFKPCLALEAIHQCYVHKSNKHLGLYLPLINSSPPFFTFTCWPIPLPSKLCQ